MSHSNYVLMDHPIVIKPDGGFIVPKKVGEGVAVNCVENIVGICDSGGYECCAQGCQTKIGSSGTRPFYTCKDDCIARLTQIAEFPQPDDPPCKRLPGGHGAEEGGHGAEGKMRCYGKFQGGECEGICGTSCNVGCEPCKHPGWQCFDSFEQCSQSGGPKPSPGTHKKRDKKYKKKSLEKKSKDPGEVEDEDEDDPINSKMSKKGLDTLDISMIIVGALIGVIILGLILWHFIIRGSAKKRKR